MPRQPARGESTLQNPNLSDSRGAQRARVSGGDSKDLEPVQTILRASKPIQQKYRAQPTIVDGIRFASQREAARYGQLLIAARAGAIADLELQVLYRFVVNGVTIGRYKPDFRYRVVETGETIVEDVKGFRVRDWSRTKKLMLALHGVTVVEV